jgi:hypothetical protein
MKNEKMKNETKNSKRFFKKILFGGFAPVNPFLKE